MQLNKSKYQCVFYHVIFECSIAGEAVEGLYCGDEAASWVSKCLSKPGCR